MSAKSDSSEDVPLVQKFPARSQPAGEPAASEPPEASDTAQDSSDEDKPLLARQPLKKKVTSAQNGTADPLTNSSVPPASGARRKKAAPSKEKGEQKEGEAADTEVKATPVKRQRKQYDLPGQTRETPGETDPLRKFYTSLREQWPESAMAAKWLCQHGLLDQEAAEEWMAQNGKGAVRSPAAKRAPPKPQRTSTPSKATKKAVNPAPKRRPRAQKDVAFADGGLDSPDEDSDSDDDKPLALRK